MSRGRESSEPIYESRALQSLDRYPTRGIDVVVADLTARLGRQKR